MTKRTVGIAVLIIVVGLAAGYAGLKYVRNHPSSSVSPQAENSGDLKTVQPTPEKMLDWQDPAGLSFSYPEGVTVDKHDEDNENYAHLEMNRIGVPGNLIVWAKDTSAQDAAAWVQADPNLKNLPSMDTTLGGLPAKKLVLKDTGRIIVGTVSDGVVFYVEASSSAYWTDTFEKVRSTFKIDGAASDSKSDSAANDQSAASDDTGGEAVDEEEIVQ